MANKCHWSQLTRRVFHSLLSLRGKCSSLWGISNIANGNDLKEKMMKIVTVRNIIFLTIDLLNLMYILSMLMSCLNGIFLYYYFIEKTVLDHDFCQLMRYARHQWWWLCYGWIDAMGLSAEWRSKWGNGVTKSD